jgi:drug/metabolite transporter (DMT)-like permease
VSQENLGYACALGTALCWAIAVVLFKKSGDGMGPLTLNMFKNLVGLLLLALTHLVVGFDAGDASARDVVYLLISGALGIGVADTLLFYGLHRIGASRQAVVDTLYSPAVVLMSFVMLDEVLATRDALGGFMILGAVALATVPTGKAKGDPATSLARGIGASALSMVLMAFAIVAVKPVLERHDVIYATTMRLVGGVFTLLFIGLASKQGRRDLVRVFAPNPALRYALPGAVMGTYFSLLLWIGAFKYAKAGVAALLNQTSTLFIVVLAAIFLHERMTPRVMLAVASAAMGSLLVLL